MSGELGCRGQVQSMYEVIADCIIVMGWEWSRCRSQIAVGDRRQAERIRSAVLCCVVFVPPVVAQGWRIEAAVNIIFVLIEELPPQYHSTVRAQI